MQNRSGNIINLLEIKQKAISNYNHALVMATSRKQDDNIASITKEHNDYIKELDKEIEFQKSRRSS